MSRLLVSSCVLVMMIGAHCRAQLGEWPEGVRLSVRIGDVDAGGPVSGRLRVHMAPVGGGLDADDSPADGPYLDHPLPIVGADVEGVAPGDLLSVPAGGAANVVTFGTLPDGEYRAQAVLDRFALDSNWRREPGNLFSEVVTLRIERGQIVGGAEIVLDGVIAERDLPEIDGVRWFSMESALLSEFHGRSVLHRTGIVFPLDYDEGRAYPAVYIVPGFGGDEMSAAFYARATRSEGSPPDLRALSREAFIIVLNPESANGHTLFVDSASNGPCGRALVEELVPALEEELNLIASPEARIVRGHSSGGWSSVWLPVRYPEVFGHGFSSAPDPVGFEHFQEASFYEVNFYVDENGALIPSNFDGYDEGRGEWLTTILQENQLEEAWGPGNSSGQQWDSWLSVFAPRNEETGWPADLFDPETGRIDPEAAEWSRRFDIVGMLRRDPERFAPIFAERVRIIVGDEDEWALHKAVVQLKGELDALGVGTERGDPGGGYITIVPGTTHGTVLGTEASRDLLADMAEAARRAGAAGTD